MGAHYQILPALLSLFLIRVDLTDLAPLVFKAPKITVLDGDTVGFGKERLRFLGIDAPEMGQRSLDGKKEAGLFAKKRLEKFIYQCQDLRLKIIKKDIFGRWLGDVVCGKKSLSEELLKSGAVALYPYAEFLSAAERDRFISWYLLAQRRRVGLWAHGGFERPGSWRKSNKRI